MRFAFMLYKYTSFPPKVKPLDKNPAALYKIGASQGLLFVHPAAGNPAQPRLAPSARAA